MNRSLNLIPAPLQRKYALRRVMRVWLRAVVVSGVCAAAFLGVEWLRGASALRELTELDARYAPLMRILKDQEDLVAKIERLNSREEIALRLSRDQHGVVLLGVLSKAAAKSDGTVYLNTLMYQGPNTNTPGEVLRTVQISGVGVDGMSVAEFASELRTTGVFDEVTIQNTEPLSDGAASLRRFSIAGSL